MKNAINFIKKIVKNNPFLASLYFSVKGLPNDAQTGFHDDPVLREMILKILGGFPISSFVETGTYRGYSSGYIASNYKGPIYTCELIGKFYRESKKNLRQYPNVNIYRGSSKKFIDSLEGKMGSLPFFFLDAHWYEYWPLLDELESIKKIDKAIILIDDFKVPDAEFGYDNGVYQGNVVDSDINFISPKLTGAKYDILFPAYPGKNKRGYVFLFKNIGEFENFGKDDFVRKNYKSANAQQSRP